MIVNNLSLRINAFCSRFGNFHPRPARHPDRYIAWVVGDKRQRPTKDPIGVFRSGIDTAARQRLTVIVVSVRRVSDPSQFLCLGKLEQPQVPEGTQGKRPGSR